MQQLILPHYISEGKLPTGSIEYLDLGKKTFRVTIPPNITFGKMLKLKGLAGHIDECFNNQDLLLLIKKEVKPFSYATRDIIMDLPIDLNSLKKTAVKRINIDTRKFDVKVPADTKYGAILRLQGLAEMCNGGYPGDVLLRIAEQPNLKTNILHKIMANFMGFDTTPSEAKFKILFKLPWLFECGGEWNFKESKSSLHGSSK